MGISERYTTERNEKAPRDMRPPAQYADSEKWLFDDVSIG